MRKIIIITGLTASGKSGLAVKIAKEYNGEIISADSVQIYKDLNIGSAKVDEKTLKEVPHHLINIKNFNESYNVGEFLKDTEKAINEIIEKGKLPIIVGGTAMYIKALLEGYTLGSTTANEELRNKYQTMAKNLGNLAVWKELEKLNPERANSVHPNNLKRVIRYIEIEHNQEELTKTESLLKDYTTLSLGIIDDRETIYSRINSRVDSMIIEGLEQEIKHLIELGATENMQAFNSIGYKEWFDFFSGKQSRNETIDLIKQHTRNYCKRQLTFLKTINGVKLTTLNEAEEEIRRFFK